MEVRARRGQACPKSVSRLGSVFGKRVTSYNVNRIPLTEPLSLQPQPLTGRLSCASARRPQDPTVPVRSRSGLSLIPLSQGYESHMRPLLSLNQRVRPGKNCTKWSDSASGVAKRTWQNGPQGTPGACPYPSSVTPYPIANMWLTVERSETDMAPGIRRRVTTYTNSELSLLLLGECTT